ncbi:OmpH and DnaJ domain-containing protein [Senna tora]|uniref:OmpH and DnaJ domain-containing protein n=1 Tax=Senna tora TaxID=362788 RepID=A0A834W9K9_9FABA|nr:OmpH and DnaJ domain-containing protein [Senna tora]
MIGKRVLEEHFQPRTCSGNRTSKTGQEKENGKNVVLIDIDGDQVDDVEIIDFPEYGQQKLQGSSVQSRDRMCPPHSVISIDDDESDDAGHPEIIAEGGGELDSDASSSKRFSPAPGSMQNSDHIDVDDCHVVHEKGSASNLPKNNQTSSAKASDRNRYGLDASESESSESDCSDCELMEVCEQWEKASVKRKRRLFNDIFGSDEQASSSGLHSNFYTDIEVENRTKEHAVSSSCSGLSNDKCGKENLSDVGDNQIDDTNLNMKVNPSKDSDKNVDQESYKFSRPGTSEKMQCIYKSSDSQHEERTRSENFPPCSNYRSYNFSSGVTGASRFEKVMGDKQSNFMSSSQEESKRQIENDGSTLRNKDGNFSEAHSTCASFDESHLNQDGLVSQESCVRDIINEREKLKETDEYKLAIEEEWASRQRQLQIQAEEAQRLRKRKKAESKRLLDMQRRQKERIEEDEENMNMKEKLRVEIRKGLDKLEMTSVDMASLLRGLGIQVGGGSNPVPQEIGLSNVLCAEMWGIAKGLELAWNMGLRRVILESDSLNAVNSYCSTNSATHSHPVVLKARELMNRDWEIHVKHTPRDSNISADLLAKSNLVTNNRLEILDSFKGQRADEQRLGDSRQAPRDSNISADLLAKNNLVTNNRLEILDSVPDFLLPSVSKDTQAFVVPSDPGG